MTLALRPDQCGDGYTPRDSDSTYLCDLAAHHEGLHFSTALGFNWAVDVCMAEAADFATHAKRTCYRTKGHLGDHEDRFAPGGSYAWSQEVSAPGPDIPERCDRIVNTADGSYPCTLCPGHGGYHYSAPAAEDFIARRKKGHGAPDGSAGSDDAFPGLEDLRRSFAGLTGPNGISTMTPERHRAANDRHERVHALALAVQALKPVAGAYDLPGFPTRGLGGRRVDYGEGIIALARQLGNHIENGT